MAILISPTGKMECDAPGKLSDTLLMMVAQFAEPGCCTMRLIEEVNRRGLFGELIRLRACEPEPETVEDH